ncbi:PilZ domain-containing protein [Myxococcus xanthus]|uniref:PilZ domain-containing protein n=1 Tax=Myxococcus xanthus TaxID=34 RepID=UPI0011276D5B|nr:PilZ domain-containing protein [Myxococcus xanthus]QDF00582.1 reductase [Myxococcus xanthus]
MMTAPGRVRPSPGPVEAAPRVLCVGATSESWLALSRALRPLRCVALQVPSLESAFLEVQHTRPSLVLVHWRQLVAGAGMGLRALRLRLGGDGPPVVLVAEPETPAEVLEVGDAEGVEDCLLSPLRTHELRARLAMLAGDGVPAAPVRASRVRSRLLLLAGASGPLAWSGLGALLEACGHRILYSATVGGGAARVAEHGERPDLVLSREGAPGVPRGLPSPRLQPLLAGVPSLTLDADAPVRPASLLPRIHALLGREDGSLRVEARVRFCCPVSFGEAGPRGAEWRSGVSSALSPGGLLVRTLVPAKAGTAVELHILLPTLGERLETHGVVAWAHAYAPRNGVSHPYGMGVRFLGMGPPRLMQLRQLCQAEVRP